jgi:hypothetical protein
LRTDLGGGFAAATSGPSGLSATSLVVDSLLSIGLDLTYVPINNLLGELHQAHPFLEQFPGDDILLQAPL